MATLLNTFTEKIEGQQDLNVSQDNNAVPKKETKQRSHYSNTKVKTRNLLTNVSYRHFKKSDFDNQSFENRDLLVNISNELSEKDVCEQKKKIIRTD